VSALVDDVLNLLCLAHSKGKRVAGGGISPSQRRRLLLAHALVQLPPVLLVQELLSGLSPACALDVLFALDTMAGRGMNVVVHIQQLCQPGFGMFDTVGCRRGGQRCCGPAWLAWPLAQPARLGPPGPPGRTGGWGGDWRLPCPCRCW
jgi:ABC-type multidrug transport system ATPase subunit